MHRKLIPMKKIGNQFNEIEAFIREHPIDTHKPIGFFIKRIFFFSETHEQSRKEAMNQRDKYQAVFVEPYFNEKQGITTAYLIIPVFVNGYLIVDDTIQLASRIPNEPDEDHYVALQEQLNYNLFFSTQKAAENYLRDFTE